MVVRQGNVMKFKQYSNFTFWYIWVHLGTFGYVWVHLGTFRYIFVMLGTFWYVRIHLEHFGTIWYILVQFHTFWTVWIHLCLFHGSFIRNLLGHLVLYLENTRYKQLCYHSVLSFSSPSLHINKESRRLLQG